MAWRLIAGANLKRGQNMKLRTIHVVALLATGFSFSQNARADNTLTDVYKITIPASLVPTVSGKEPCKGRKVEVTNTSGGPVTVVLKDGDGTVIINAAIANEASKSATFKKTGTPKIKINALPENDLPPIPLAFCPGVPTLSEWSVVAMVLLLLAAGTIVFGRFQRPATASS